MSRIKFKCDNDIEIEADVEVAKWSTTISNMLADISMEVDSIALPIDSVMLTKALEFCAYHKDKPLENKETPNGNHMELTEWDNNFFQDLNKDGTIKLLLVRRFANGSKLIFQKASNFLDIPMLLNASAQYIANTMKGKTPEEIRQYYDIKNDLTPEEEEEIKKENSWTEER